MTNSLIILNIVGFHPKIRVKSFFTISVLPFLISIKRLSRPVVSTPTSAPNINTPNNVTIIDTIRYPHNWSLPRAPVSIT